MPQTFTLPKQVVIDPLTLLPSPGAKAYFYITGTSTPQPVYADDELATPITQPVVADSAGVLQTIYLGATSDYKLTLNRSDGSLLYTIDPIGSGSVLSTSIRYGITPAETAAGVTPVNYYYFYGDIRRYGASTADATGTTNVAALVAAALVFVNGGPAIYVPTGTFICNAAIAVPTNCRIYGDGQFSSIVTFTNAGDGFTSTYAVNSSSNAQVKIENIWMKNTNGANTGGAIAQVGGSGFKVHNCSFTGWKYHVIFDQTEVAEVRGCFHETFTRAAIWIVNGADHTVGALQNYTNVILVDFCWMNCTGAVYPVLDDGGLSHAITNNTFQGVSSPSACRFSGVNGLDYRNNFSEGFVNNDIVFEETTLAGTFCGPCAACDVSGGNEFSSVAATNNILANSLINSKITGNQFYNSVSGCISLANYSYGNIIEGNDKLLYKGGLSSAIMVNGSSSLISGNINRQIPQTYVAGSISAGAASVTTGCNPASEGFKVGANVVCRNADGTGSEVVTLTGVSSTQLTAVWGAHSANWIVRGLTPMTAINGSGAFSAATTVVVTFPYFIPTSNYRVMITPTSLPAGFYYVSAKSNTTFTVTCASSTSFTFDYKIEPQ
jgi:hypothetical protein